MQWPRHRASSGEDTVEYALVIAALCLGLLFPLRELARSIAGLYGATTPAVRTLASPGGPTSPLAPPPAPGHLRREQATPAPPPPAKGAPLGALLSWLTTLFLLALALGAILVHLVRQASRSSVEEIQCRPPPLKLAIGDYPHAGRAEPPAARKLGAGG